MSPPRAQRTVRIGLFTGPQDPLSVSPPPLQNALPPIALLPPHTASSALKTQATPGSGPRHPKGRAWLAHPQRHGPGHPPFSRHRRSGLWPIVRSSSALSMVLKSSPLTPVPGQRGVRGLELRYGSRTRCFAIRVEHLAADACTRAASRNSVFEVDEVSQGPLWQVHWAGIALLGCGDVAYGNAMRL